MGDKSPKSKQRQQKQNTTAKNQKKADAYTKAHPAQAPTLPGRKNK